MWLKFRFQLHPWVAIILFLNLSFTVSIIVFFLLFRCSLQFTVCKYREKEYTVGISLLIYVEFAIYWHQFNRHQCQFGFSKVSVPFNTIIFTVHVTWLLHLDWTWLCAAVFFIYQYRRSVLTFCFHRHWFSECTT